VVIFCWACTTVWRRNASCVMAMPSSSRAKMASIARYVLGMELTGLGLTRLVEIQEAGEVRPQGGVSLPQRVPPEAEPPAEKDTGHMTGVAGAANSNWAAVNPCTSARYHGPMPSQPGHSVRADTDADSEAGKGCLLHDRYVPPRPPVS
jgi:hypothetical protein